MPDKDYLAAHSIYIENVMRHCFLFEVTRVLLTRNEPQKVAILNAEVDDAGIDIVLALGSVTRHIQLKSLAKKLDGRITTVTGYNVAESISSIPGGCVLWLVYDRATMQPLCYHLMGGRGNEMMKPLADAKIATRRKKGIKVERSNYRRVYIRHAEHRNLNIEELIDILFDLPPDHN